MLDRSSSGYKYSNQATGSMGTGTLGNNEAPQTFVFKSQISEFGLVFFYPYWLFFEFGAPIVEFLGLICIILFGVLGLINWTTAILLFTCVYLIGCIFSTVAIFLYIKNFKHYSSLKQVSELLLAAYLEPFLYHPVLLFGQMKGYYKMIFGIKSGWGTMTRKGFNTTTTP